MEQNRLLNNKSIILLLIFIIVSVCGFASTCVFENQTNISEVLLDKYNKVTTDPNVIWSVLSYVEIDSIVQSENLILSLDNETISVELIYSKVNGDEYYMHFSSENKEADVFLSILDHQIYGDIMSSSGSYLLQSISTHDIVISKYEINMNEDIDSYEEDISDIGNENPIATISSTPTIRVLFLYTNEVISNMGLTPYATLKQTVYLNINQANESFYNSNVNANLQLAYIGPTNYDETSFSWDVVLSHFSNANDGYIDEVHTLRNKYAADICVLLIHKNGLCGKAKVINATASTAFCLADPKYSCNTKFTPIHEIGHLVGCRHDRLVDNTNTPYQYGHGYVHYTGVSSSSWRTMMAYDSACVSSACKRILYWSNPSIYYEGYATGTTTYENNARVWNERAGTVAAFRNEAAQIAYTSANNNTTALFESIIATSLITTSGGFEVQSGQTIDMVAPAIQLKSGTHIKNGAIFRATTQSNSNLYYGTTPISTDTIGGNLYNNKHREAANISDNKRQINIYSIDGKLLQQCLNCELSSISLPNGVYIIRAIAEDGTIYQSKILIQK